MTPPRSIDSNDSQAYARVLTDPSLMRYIGSFQSGLPLSLYHFWVQHEPTARYCRDANEFHFGLDRLQSLVIVHGSTQQLDLLCTVQWYWRGRLHFVGNESNLSSMSRRAIEANRPEMLQWAITHNTRFDYGAFVWREAFRWYRSGDLRVLDLLRVHRPRPAIEHIDKIRGNRDAALARWLELHFPTATVSANSVSHAQLS